MTWTFRPELRRVLWLTVAVLVVASVASDLVESLDSRDVPGLSSIAELLDADAERSLFTWFSAALLASCALMAFVVGGRDASHRTGWRATGALFVLLSLDEVAGMHERLGFLMMRTFDASFFAWVIPGAILVGLVLAVGWPFIRSLDAALRRGLLLGAAVLIGGGLLIETGTGVLAETISRTTLAYRLATSVEEAVELTGTLLILGALWRHLDARDTGLVVRFRG